MHKKILFSFLLGLCFLICSATGLQAQVLTPAKLGFDEYTLNDKKLGTVHYYVSTTSKDKQKPVLIYLDGSGPFPLFQYTPQGTGSSVVIDFKKLSETYHIVLISKPGVPFVDSVKFDPATGPEYPAPKEYDARLSLQWRVGAARMALSDVLKQRKADMKKIAVMGISEGFQVATRLAAEDKRVNRLVVFVGNGLSQFYDFLLQERISGKAGEETAAQAQENIDTLYQQIKDIYKYPEATDKYWYGHTYLRWSSFGNNNPTENLMSLSIPVYIVGCSNDHNSAIAGTDYLYLESIRRKKTNILYKVYPYDHSFNEYEKDKDGKVLSAKSHMKEVIAASLEWLEKL